MDHRQINLSQVESGKKKIKYSGVIRVTGQAGALNFRNSFHEKVTLKKPATQRPGKRAIGGRGTEKTV